MYASGRDRPALRPLAHWPIIPPGSLCRGACQWRVLRLRLRARRLPVLRVRVCGSAPDCGSLPGLTSWPSSPVRVFFATPRTSGWRSSRIAAPLGWPSRRLRRESMLSSWIACSTARFLALARLLVRRPVCSTEQVFPRCSTRGVRHATRGLCLRASAASAGSATRAPASSSLEGRGPCPRCSPARAAAQGRRR